MAASLPSDPPFDALASGLIAAGRRFDAQGWVPATSGNFSARISDTQIAITASGRHKGELAQTDILRMDVQGQVLGAGRPSYETALHLQLYRRDAAIAAVLHSHSVAATVLSRRCGAELILQGYELQKLFEGYSDPGRPLRLPVFPNEQDIEQLAAQIDAHMGTHGTGHAYLIAGHGLYSWGESIDQARHRIEALEFMLACELATVRQAGLGNETRR